MGEDKASLSLGGLTLLERALSLLAGVCAPVFVAGERVRTPPGVAQVADAAADCGPMGGIAAALCYAERRGVEWVVLLPVDMPLLPAGLLAAMVDDWRGAAERGAWVCCAEADGRVQPLVSAVHTSVRPALEASLGAGRYRVRPALEEAATALAQVDGSSAEQAFYRMLVGENALPGAWRPSAAEWQRRALWFGNVNTPEDLAVAAEALALPLDKDDWEDRQVGE